MHAGVTRKSSMESAFRPSLAAQKGAQTPNFGSRNRKNTSFREKRRGKFAGLEGNAYFCTAFKKRRALSSVGSERLPYKQRVGGSNPSVPTSFSRIAILPRATEGHLAQLVQSVCLTSRGSGVRIPQCPLPFPQVARRSSERMNIFPERALSSVGSERLPYKQRVGGSNPSVPTKKKRLCRN